MIRTRPLLLSAGLLLCLWAFASTAEAAGKLFGKRVMFDEGVGWATKAGAEATLLRIKDAGFNVYVPCVWHGRGTSWPSKLAPWDPYLGEFTKRPSYDPLKYLINRAHAMGIEVHPWFTVALRQGELFSELAPAGTPKDAFDVHDPRFSRLMADLIAEVVRTYDVDGINLDYVRAMGLCLNAACKQEYKGKYGRDLDADAGVFLKTPGQVPTLIEYQETAVTAMVRTISEKVREIKPAIPISADAIPGVASLDQGQNSLDWVNRRHIDALFRMDYYRAIDVSLTESLRGKLDNPDALTVLISNVSNAEEMAPGQAIFSRDGRWLADTIAMIRQRWPGTGNAVYLYSMLTDEQIAALKQGPFKNKPRYRVNRPSR